jgi:hypothetical protein
MSIEAKQVLVTPAQASKWLEKHYEAVAKSEFRQRTVSRTTVEKYATDMRCGQWLLDPNPIVFDENGNLINGQHRLEAVRKSGCTIAFFISTGWDEKQNGVSTIDCIDRGRPRSIGQQFSLHGVPYATKIAASVASIARVVNSGRAIPMSYGSSKYILDTLGLQTQIEALLTLGNVNKLGGKFIGPIA